MGCPVDHDFDPLAPDFLRDPFEILARLDDDTPVFYAPSLDYYVVTRHADIDAVFRDNETFSAANAQLPLVPLDPEAGRILLAGGHKRWRGAGRRPPSRSSTRRTWRPTGATCASSWRARRPSAPTTSPARCSRSTTRTRRR
jgi:cytochrome P450